ncbi:hypothetical protein ABFX02_10G080600 [Erythranthe guttata]
MSLPAGLHTEFLLPRSALHRWTIPSRQNQRAWKRRRLKPLTLRSHLNPFDSIFHSLISQFSSANSLNLIAPTLGLASGLALFFSSSSPKFPAAEPPSIGNSDTDIGEWILFTSPTPFNRFVTLRCRSIYFPGNELLENVNEKLVKEERHYVKLNSGRMIQLAEGDGDVDENMVYQRICIDTEDGGVLSLDWPVNLDLEEERGLDTTVLIVPGTAEGSNERKIRVFVCDCLRRGVFPVVMNPRGCAGSPLTTARLFTAADSDDISTAVQHINKKRPWTTLMGVGWGYGANMLTKYLAESGERTPLTAATCIDNPFDLEEAMRSSVYNNTDFKQRHVDGLIKILQCNKELFQGRGKGFDVERALSASSIWDFDTAISMVSLGYDTIEEFYAKSSTRDVVGKVKVPVLFIQNDDGKFPLFSIPRSLIAENPYTSLLLCSYSPSSRIMDDRFTFSWCQHLTLEWLAAVELGLLKGRHPLLQDVDVTINPSKGLALVESGASSNKERVDKLLNLTNGNSTASPLEIFQANDTTGIQSRSAKDIGGLPPITEVLQKGDKNVGKQSVEEGINSDNERGQVLQTAEMVVNMLDVNMPGTLTDDQKKKVLNAVGQGETVMKALQDAVPEDVREKLTSTVSGILQSRASNLKFDKLLSRGQTPDVTSDEVQEKTRPAKSNSDEDVHSLDQTKRTNDPGNGRANVDRSSDEASGGVESEKHSPEISQKSNETDIDQSTSNHVSKTPDPEKVNLNDKENSSENDQTSGGSIAKISDKEKVLNLNADQEPDGAKGIVADQMKVERESGEVRSDQMDEKNKQENDISVDQNKISEAPHTGETSSDPSVIQKEAENNQPKSGDPPSFSVSEALGALTEFDDSTQFAVNSVFHVIEDMIDQLEVDKGNKNEVKNPDNGSELNEINEVKESDYSVSKNQLMENNDESSWTIDLRINASTQSGNSNGTTLHDPPGSGYKEEPEYFTHREHSGNSSEINNTRSQVGNENDNSFVPAAGELSEGNFLNFVPYEDPLYKEYLQKYLDLKIRNEKLADMAKMPSSYFEYVPEEGRWKLLERKEDNTASADDDATREGGFTEHQADTQPRSEDADRIIEPTYAILDSGKAQHQTEELTEMSDVNENTEFREIEFTDSMHFIKNLIIECLNVEVGRRNSVADVEELDFELARETEYVANAVSMAAVHGVNDNLLENPGTLDGDNIIKAISSAVQNTQYLRRVLPVGVVVGASLVSLRKFYDVAVLDGNDENNLARDHVDKSTEKLVQVSEKESDERVLKKTEDKDYLASSVCEEEEDNIVLGNSNNNGVMVGAVTAALGASALFAHQSNTETGGTLGEPLKEKETSKVPSKVDEMSEKTENNIVTSLAEKAMSVASPVVPTKEDGEVDQERLVAMLAELGQKGGILKLVGKVALLWGGIRGAMSLTDKLISFLRIAERPLVQRILCFILLVLLLWSPIVLPLLPTLIQNWATHSPFKIAECACIAGLYASVMAMITLWGKRVRKYDDPLVQYGLDLTSVPKNFLKGLVGGGVLVITIHAVNSSLGCAHLHWPTTLSTSSAEPVVALIKSYGKMLMLIAQGIVTAAGISAVEEVLFRSWLPQEIASDFGYHYGLVLSGLIFALSQRSMREIPGLWLLSLSLSGARHRNGGSLSLPIGIRAGILSSSFVLKTGGFLTYQTNIPPWITGGHPFQPFSGVVGLVFSLVLAVVLYPRQPLHKKKPIRVIRG